MKTFTLALFTIATTSFAFGQVQLERQVIGSAGASASQGNIQLEYTVGEAVVTTASSGSIVLTQGFNQPGDFPIGIQIPEYNIGIQAYPNPTATELILEVENPDQVELNLLVFNALGQQMPDHAQQIAPANNQTIRLNFGAVATGQYFLEIRSSQGTVRTVPVQVVR